MILKIICKLLGRTNKTGEYAIKYSDPPVKVYKCSRCKGVVFEVKK